MYKHSRRVSRIGSRYLSLLLVLTVAGFMVGCASSQQAGDELLPSDEMMEGPGLFSGEDGTFSIITLNKDGTYTPAEKPAEESVAQDVSKENLQGTSDILEQKINELEQQQEELEQLQRDVKKKLETN